MESQFNALKAIITTLKQDVNSNNFDIEELEQRYSDATEQLLELKAHSSEDFSFLEDELEEINEKIVDYDEDGELRSMFPNSDDDDDEMSASSFFKD